MVRAYRKQVLGYEQAEGTLERKWLEKYNVFRPLGMAWTRVREKR